VECKPLVDGAAAFLEDLITEMWGATVTASAKPWTNGAGVARESGDGTVHPADTLFDRHVDSGKAEASGGACLGGSIAHGACSGVEAGGLTVRGVQFASSIDDGGQRSGSRGGAVQVDPIKPTLKAPGTKRLKLNHGKPLSSFAFNFNLRRYTAGGTARRPARRATMSRTVPGTQWMARTDGRTMGRAGTNGRTRGRAGTHQWEKVTLLPCPHTVPTLVNSRMERVPGPSPCSASAKGRRSRAPRRTTSFRGHEAASGFRPSPCHLQYRIVP